MVTLCLLSHCKQVIVETAFIFSKNAKHGRYQHAASYEVNVTSNSVSLTSQQKILFLNKLINHALFFSFLKCFISILL